MVTMISNINTNGRFMNTSKYRDEHGENVTISFNGQTEAILIWAEMKMLEERHIAILAKTNPTVADAAQSLKTAEEQLRMVMELLK
jgi:hypothetical protein